MRAKTVNEVQEFERGLNPKAAMEIGGIDLEKVCNNTAIKGLKEWNKYLQQFIGKKITFSRDMSQYASEMYRKLNKKYTCVVNDVGINWQLPRDVQFTDENGDTWHVDIEDKIYVNES